MKLTSSETVTTMGEIWDTISHGELDLTVQRLGAEPVSLRRNTRDGSVGYLYRDGDMSDAISGWQNRCTLMGYHVQRLVNEKSDYEGDMISSGTHGFLRHHRFGAPTKLKNGLEYSIQPDEIPSYSYPRKVSARIRYLLLEESFRFEIELQNEEKDRPAHVSFGWHPGFHVGSLTECGVLLPECMLTRILAPNNFLSGETATLDHPGGLLRFPPKELPNSYIFDLRDSELETITICDIAGSRRITMSLEEVPFLTIWSDGGKFLCVEPCWGIADHHKQRPFQDKLGMETIAPGESLIRGITLTPENTNF